jgi:hypothetical protein
MYADTVVPELTADIVVKTPLEYKRVNDAIVSPTPSILKKSHSIVEFIAVGTSAVTGIESIGVITTKGIANDVTGGFDTAMEVGPPNRPSAKSVCANC